MRTPPLLGMIGWTLPSNIVPAQVSVGTEHRTRFIARADHLWESTRARLVTLLERFVSLLRLA
ncbi:MAG: hypothetical protein ABJB12_13370 [Pseudomonadota bacterium]